MIEHDQSRAMALARVLGVVQEARRIGSRLVGSEHMLMASFADPVVRTALRADCDMRDVQCLVTRTAEERERAWRIADERTAVELTPQAAELMLRAGAMVDGLSSHPRPDPAVYSAALGAVMLTLLRDTDGSAARRILDELGVRERSETIEARLSKPLADPEYPAPPRR